MLEQKISTKKIGWRKHKGLICIILMFVLFSVNVDMASAANYVVSDDFSAPALNTSLWTTIDPLGDATFTMTGTGTSTASVNIAILSGIHNAWGVNKAPRIMQTVDNSNFEIEAKFLSQITKPYQIQGIIIEQDSANYLRFDFSRNSTTTYVFAASTTAGVTTMRYVANIIPGTNPLYLRVNRSGNEWDQSYSYDGINWTPGAKISHTLAVSRVGPFAGTSANLAFTGKIDYFFNTSAPVIPEDPPAPTNITLWYGKSQKFGQIGVPQKWINILGNVRSGSGIATLNYSLNNAIAANLSIGTQSLRLSSIGDFNIEINRSDLLCADNQVKINAKDNLGNTRTEIVTVNYSCNNVWPLPYFINWRNVANIQDAAQVVDGLWTKDANSILPAIIGYDRLIAIGDMNWTDYEITVPITINTPLVSSAPNGGPNFGLSMRWQGHNKNSNEQPGAKWWTIGAIGGYMWNGTAYQIQMIGHSATATSTIAKDTSGKQLTVGVPYMFKMRAKTNGTRTLYTLKVWEQAASELTAVTISGYGDTIGLKQGSAMLNAHYSNVSFGNVTIRPLDQGPDICCVSVGAYENNATVRWTTDKPASSNVSYGSSTAYQDGSVVDGTLVLSHAILLKGLQPGTMYHYKINSTDNGGNSTNTTDLNFTTLNKTKPNITAQPENKKTINGSEATFSVVATGTEPLSYQWKKNGVNIITDGTSSSYTTPTVYLPDSGTKYSVVVSNSLGSVTSNDATLSVIEKTVPENWWNSIPTRNFRVPVTIDSTGFERYEKPVDVSINFTQALGLMGQTGTLDETSIRVVESDINGELL